MKVILNTTTNYEGKLLRPGNEIDVPLNIAQRWINRGIAHTVKAEPKPEIKPKVKAIAKKATKIKEAVFEEPEIKVKKAKKIKKIIEEIEDDRGEIATSNFEEINEL